MQNHENQFSASFCAPLVSSYQLFGNRIFRDTNSHKTRKRCSFVQCFPVLHLLATQPGADGRIRIDHVHFPQRRQAAYVLTFRRFRGFLCPRLLPRKTRRKGKNKGEFSLPKPLTLCPIRARRSRFRMGKKSCTAGGLRYPGHIVKTFFAGGRRQGTPQARTQAPVRPSLRRLVLISPP